MGLEETNLTGCFTIEPAVFEDHRGVFFESYNQKKLNEAVGQPVHFVQDNHSISKKGVLRGLHFQEGDHSQAKLVRVVEGEVLDVVVDLRRNSPTFGQHYKTVLSAANRLALFIPRGMAHGFLSLSDHTVFVYKCDNYYEKSSERGIRYDDPVLNIDWNFPDSRLILSEKDKILPYFNQLTL